jgi:hypothetical protein
MRVMMFVKGDTQPGQLPSEEIIEAMGRYNEELTKAGVLLDLNGLHPSGDGKRVRFSEGKRTTVIDGPFAESKELVAGYWILQVKWMRPSSGRNELRSSRGRSMSATPRSRSGRSSSWRSSATARPSTRHASSRRSSRRSSAGSGLH